MTTPKSKATSSLTTLVEMVVMGSVLALLKRLHNSGALLPRLSRGQFYGVLMATLLALVGVAFVVERLVVRKRKQTPS